MGNRTIAVTGATGFVGRHAVRALLDAGFSVRALVRDRAKARRVLPEAAPGRLTLVQGDGLQRRSMEELVQGANAAVQLIGILRENGAEQTFQRMHVETTRLLLEACTNAGVKRYVQMSALGVNADGPAKYQSTKWAAEELVRASGLSWTVLRPGLILGEGSEFVTLAKGWFDGNTAPWIFVPYFTGWREDHSVPAGSVTFTDPVVQPVAVEDVAKAVVAALTHDNAVGEIYNIVGPERLSWPEMLVRLRQAVSPTSATPPFGIPGKIAALVAKGASIAGMGGVLPFDEGMALMGSQDSIAETRKAEAHLGLKPRRVLAAAH